MIPQREGPTDKDEWVNSTFESEGITNICLPTTKSCTRNKTALNTCKSWTKKGINKKLDKVSLSRIKSGLECLKGNQNELKILMGV